MADGRKKRSLREAFGVVGTPEEPRATQQTTEGTSSAGPVGAPEGGKPAPPVREKTAKPAPRKRRASSNGSGSSGGTRTRRNANRDGAGDPATVREDPQAGSAGRRGRAALGDGGQKEAGEMVPGKGGRMVPAETPVNMTFTVTAKERYLWTLELKRRGLTAVGVLRERMEGLLEEGAGES